MTPRRLGESTATGALRIQRAAPDLLVALELLLPLVDHDRWEARQARAAITRARGDRECCPTAEDAPHKLSCTQRKGGAA